MKYTHIPYRIEKKMPKNDAKFIIMTTIESYTQIKKLVAIANQLVIK